jgi:hypothetical protein
LSVHTSDQTKPTTTPKSSRAAIMSLNIPGAPNAGLFKGGYNK